VFGVGFDLVKKVVIGGTEQVLDGWNVITAIPQTGRAVLRLAAASRDARGRKPNTFLTKRAAHTGSAKR